MNKYIMILNNFLGNKEVSVSELRAILNELDIYQASVLCYLIYKSSQKEKYSKELNFLFLKYKNILKYLDFMFEKDMSTSKSNGTLYEILELINVGGCIGKDRFSFFINELIKNNLEPEYVGIFLIHVYIKGLNDDDLFEFTIAMRDSGPIFDYKNDFPDRKIIRRYPTGALSEKMSLLLPSMLLFVAKEYPIISTFLVAKSLSFTGGTWDKLGVIEGFVFPDPGPDTVNVLKLCNVSMTVAKKNLCPADTILYKIRSITGTVASIPLAVSSIASKQLASPADLLLLDVRYGDGAFFMEKDVENLINKIGFILTKLGFDLINKTTEMIQPNGSSLGNRLEVCEAIAIMKNELCIFNEEGINEQKKLLIDFFSEIMAKTLPSILKEEWSKYGEEMISSGNLLKSFSELLLAHKVSNENVNNLIDNPLEFLGMIQSDEIFSSKSGKLIYINQKKIGNIVNFGFDDKSLVIPNILLNFRIGNHINKNDKICTLYFSSVKTKITKEFLSEILECFEII